MSAFAEWFDRLAPVVSGAMKLLNNRDARNKKKVEELDEIEKAISGDDDPGLSSMRRSRWWVRRNS
jgi:hypothetical protein